jgi:hypothetical protein
VQRTSKIGEIIKAKENLIEITQLQNLQKAKLNACDFSKMLNMMAANIWGFTVLHYFLRSSP